MADSVLLIEISKKANNRNCIDYFYSNSNIPQGYMRFTQYNICNMHFNIIHTIHIYTNEIKL